MQLLLMAHVSLLPIVTHICASPTWLESWSSHIVLVKDIQLYVFCDKYRESRMRRHQSGAFEIYFVAEQGMCIPVSLSCEHPVSLAEGERWNRMAR